MAINVSLHFFLYGSLYKNQILYHINGSKRIADNTLVAIALMIAESKPDEKDMSDKSGGEFDQYQELMC